MYNLFNQYEMTDLQALRTLRRHNRIPRQDAREMRSILLSDREIPDRLYPLAEALWLMQLRLQQMQ